jgi:uncharacterized protein YecE (DUF72 family)
LKASRLITHVKRLQNCEEPLDNFISRARRLGDHLGPILYQLPPRWLPNTARLEAFAQLLPHDLLHVFEFRDPRWLVDPVREVLARHQLSFCIFDMPNAQCPHWVTRPLVYLRFHGSTALYAGRYSHEELAQWAVLVRQQAASGHDVYTYFKMTLGETLSITRRNCAICCLNLPIGDTQLTSPRARCICGVTAQR